MHDPNNRKPKRSAKNTNIFPKTNKNTFGSDSAEGRRYQLNRALDGDCYASVEKQFECWFPPIADNDNSWNEFQEYLKQQRSTPISKTFFRSSKRRIGRKRKLYVDHFIKSFNLVS